MLFQGLFVLVVAYNNTFEVNITLIYVGNSCIIKGIIYI